VGDLQADEILRKVKSGLEQRVSAATKDTITVPSVEDLTPVKVLEILGQAVNSSSALTDVLSEVPIFRHQVTMIQSKCDPTLCEEILSYLDAIGSHLAIKVKTRAQQIQVLRSVLSTFKQGGEGTVILPTKESRNG